MGDSIYDRDHGGFSFQTGPIFAQLVLADEVTRAPHKQLCLRNEKIEDLKVTVKEKKNI